MKMPAFIVSLFEKLQRKRAPKNEEQPLRLMTVAEFSKQFDVPFHAFRARVARRYKKATNEPKDSYTVVKGRLVRTYRVEFLEEAAKGLIPESVHVQTGKKIAEAYQNGCHDLTDFCHCPSGCCTHDICNSCLRNPKHFPGATMSFFVSHVAHVEGDKCTRYCGYTAELHSKHVLYGHPEVR